MNYQQAKYEWLNNKYAEIEKIQNINVEGM